MVQVIEGKKLKAYLCECRRCGKEWVSRQERPKICPYCKSAGWETPRKGNENHHSL